MRRSSHLNRRSDLCVNCARRFATPVLANMLDSLVRVSRRGVENHFARISPEGKPRSAARRPKLSRAANRSGRARRSVETERSRNTGYLLFRFSNFRHYLTLFSKFFASFPHGTCSLSVSHQYLALDGIYHPLRAALPSNSTPRIPTGSKINRHYGIFTLHDVPFQEILYPVIMQGSAPIDYNSRRIWAWAIPASVALTEGILVSFFSSA